jgi:alkylation response protein AidB-like acyl-CoA dehydrogenase
MLKDSDRQIVDSIAELLDSSGGLDRVRRLQGGARSFDRAVWLKLAANGWLGAAVPEAQGGAGLGAREMLLLLEEAGKRLMPEPLVLALAASRILSRCNGEASAKLLAKLIAGETMAVAVEPEEGAAFAAEGGKLTSVSAYALDGHVADCFLALVTRDGKPRAVVIPRNAPGVTIESEDTVDGGSITRLRFAGVPLSDLAVLSDGSAAPDAFRAGRDLALLGYAALLVGLMDEALAITVQYLKDRKQFGVPIGSFQALQHRAASLYVTNKASRALLYEAARAGTERRSIAALAAKSYAAENALEAVKECVALHGAIGYTAEYKMSLYFRRAMALAVGGGDAIACRKRLHALREERAVL